MCAFTVLAARSEHTHVCTHTYTCAHKHTHKRTHTCTKTHKHTHARTLTRTRTRTRTRTHTHTHTHTQVWERMKVVIEPSAACSVAAVLKEDFRRLVGTDVKKVGVILCGGNADLDKIPWMK